MAAKKEEFKPGDEVQTSGIYEIRHTGGHVETDEKLLEVTCVKGRTFPPCRVCKGRITFRLVHAAHHMREHPSLDVPPKKKAKKK